MTNTLILPVGQSLGPAVQDGSLVHRVEIGGGQLTLTEGPFRVWQAAHSTREQTDAFWGPRDALEMSRGMGVADPESCLDDLMTAGLVQVVEMTVRGVGNFIVDHRIETRLTIHGPSAEREGFWVVGWGELALTQVTPDTANIMLYGPTFDTVWDTIRAVVAVSPSQVPAEVAHLPKERMIAEKFLMEATALLSVGAICFTRLPARATGGDV